MSDLKGRIKSRSASLVRREEVYLPALQEKVKVRGMMFGESQRVAELTGPKQSFTMIALAVEDPETGAPLWNANSAVDHEEIAALPIKDVGVLVEVITRLSGLDDAEGKSDSGEIASSPSSSPEPSAEPSAT